MLSATLSAYATEAGLDPSGWSALRKQAHRVAYRMGIEASRYGVADFVPTTLQGLKKLAVGTTDVYIDFDDHVAMQLRRQVFVESRRIVWAGAMERFRVHAYLSPKRRAGAQAFGHAEEDAARAKN